MQTDSSPVQERQPFVEEERNPVPEFRPFYPGVDKFKGQVVMITGGDSGIGRACALAFANEGAHVAVIYKDGDEDAIRTKTMVENYGVKCILIPGDVGDHPFCYRAVEKTIRELGRIDCLINNAGENCEQKDFEDISEEQLICTFRTSIFSQFYLIQAALKYLPEKTGTIINNASVNASKGNSHHLDYTATKGAMLTLTDSLSQALSGKGIRVNAVIPGKKCILHPNKAAGAFTWLHSKEASYVTGQVIQVTT